MPPREGDISWREKVAALRRVARYNPLFTAGLVVFGAGVAFFEGIGLTFIYPILEVGQHGAEVEATDFIMEAFLTAYALVGLPFSLGYLILGIAGVMTIRFTSAFLANWLAAILQYRFERDMRSRAFDAALHARIGYYDAEGSDDILNAIITETRYAGRVIRYGVRLLQTSFLALMYLSVMIYIAPWMSLLAVVLLAGITLIIRHGIEPAFTVGSRVARANQTVQQAVQAGTQGIRDVKLFGLTSEVYTDFTDAVDQYAKSSVVLQRNQEAVKQGYQLSAAITLFILIYVGFAFTGLSIAALGLFLFAMFQLAPMASQLNSLFYKLEGELAHLVRTYAFVDELRAHEEDDGDRSIDRLDHIEYDDVSFAYGDEAPVLKDISFSADRGDFIAFVGQSGAGKSTIVSLLARMYEPNSGTIRGNSVPIEEYDIDAWRERIAVVRQQPFIFNDTLANNVTIGNRDVTREEVERVCEIAKVDEFANDLPNGYDSLLGDDGVRLSGGQRQRVALARALLKDADFLILDEATSDLDSNLEREVQRNIEAMDRDYGIIAIAHRLSTVENADVIYTLEAGRITEAGTHDDLVDNGGKYAELYAIQSSN